MHKQITYGIVIALTVIFCSVTINPPCLIASENVVNLFAGLPEDIRKQPVFNNIFTFGFTKYYERKSLSTDEKDRETKACCLIMQSLYNIPEAVSFLAHVVKNSKRMSPQLMGILIDENISGTDFIKAVFGEHFVKNDPTIPSITLTRLDLASKKDFHVQFKQVFFELCKHDSTLPLYLMNPEITITKKAFCGHNRDDEFIGYHARADYTLKEIYTAGDMYDFYSINEICKDLVLTPQKNTDAGGYALHIPKKIGSFLLNTMAGYYVIYISNEKTAVLVHMLTAAYNIDLTYKKPLNNALNKEIVISYFFKKAQDWYMHHIKERPNFIEDTILYDMSSEEKRALKKQLGEDRAAYNAAFNTVNIENKPFIASLPSDIEKKELKKISKKKCRNADLNVIKRSSCAKHTLFHSILLLLQKNMPPIFAFPTFFTLGYGFQYYQRQKHSWRTLFSMLPYSLYYIIPSVAGISGALCTGIVSVVMGFKLSLDIVLCFGPLYKRGTWFRDLHDLRQCRNDMGDEFANRNRPRKPSDLPFNIMCYTLNTICYWGLK